MIAQVTSVKAGITRKIYEQVAAGSVITTKDFLAVSLCFHLL